MYECYCKLQAKQHLGIESQVSYFHCTAVSIVSVLT